MSDSDETPEGFCGNCGAKNPLQSKFCFKCGEKLLWANEETLTPQTADVAPATIKVKSSPEIVPPLPVTTQYIPQSELGREPNPRQGIWILIWTLGVAFVIIVAIYNSSKDVDAIPGQSIKEPVIVKQRAEAANHPKPTVAQLKSQAEQKKKQENEQKLAQVAQKKADKRHMNKLVVKELASYSKAGFQWRNFLIRHNISKDDLISLAKKIHNEDPNSHFRFVDDDSKFSEFMQWDINYPNPSYPYPEKWVNDHSIAMVNIMLSSNGERWELSDGYETIAALD